jgi:hypothetical protein
MNGFGMIQQHEIGSYSVVVKSSLGNLKPRVQSLRTVDFIKLRKVVVAFYQLKIFFFCNLRS